MEDRKIWGRAVAAVSAEYAALPAAIRDRVRESAVAIRTAKRELHRLAEEMQSGEICASCGGECCMRGKNHFTVVDLLVFLAAAAPLFEPRFGRDLCPCHNERGCMMVPEFRPFNCVTFNCERVEELWEPERVEDFYIRERELRRLYGELELLFANRFMCGLLMSCGRDGTVGAEKILKFSERWNDGDFDH